MSSEQLHNVLKVIMISTIYAPTLNRKNSCIMLLSLEPIHQEDTRWRGEEVQPPEELCLLESTYIFTKFMNIIAASCSRAPNYSTCVLTRACLCVCIRVSYVHTHLIHTDRMRRPSAMCARAEKATERVLRRRGVTRRLVGKLFWLVDLFAFD